MIKVSIVIPCYNEEKFIGSCLESILNQDYLRLRQGFGEQAKEKIEVLVVDGMSKDRTREIVKNFQISNPNFQIRILDNPKRFTPFGLNIGIKNAKGEIIIRMDAHAIYQKDYISKCLRYLKESGADNVGGQIKTLPSKNTLIARAIANCLSSFFGVGSSWFRLGSQKPRYVDTVFGGCYKKEVFERIGYFNEKLIRSQDIEFNERLKRAGGKILLVPEIVSFYYPQSTFWNFFWHNFQDGIWTIYPLKFKVKIFSFRHLLPLFFVLTLPLNIWLYIPVSFYPSFKIALKEKDFRFFFLMPVAFFCRHFGYGLGSIWGLVKILRIKN